METKEVEETEEATTELYYEVKPENGDVNITIIANRGSHVRILSGQPQNPPTKPPGGGN